MAVRRPIKPGMGPGGKLKFRQPHEPIGPLGSGWCSPDICPQGLGRKIERDPAAIGRESGLPAGPLLCLQACEEEERCKAWTYVKPGHQGRNARCWLKHRVPNPRPADCCTSGVK